MFQSPSLRGSGRFPVWRRRRCSCAWRFQSPSLRGSGRFEAEAEQRAQQEGFNPLHCGAVVASLDCGVGAGRRCQVSIPFIAGQWSLRVPPHGGWAKEEPVSIPFIAGQWSLRVRLRLPVGDDAEFQSPSLRGSGRFKLASYVILFGRLFQSPSLRGSGRFSRPGRRPPATMWWFQSPSLRGSGRFSGKGCSIC